MPTVGMVNLHEEINEKIRAVNMQRKELDEEYEALVRVRTFIEHVVSGWDVTYTRRPDDSGEAK